MTRVLAALFIVFLTTDLYAGWMLRGSAGTELRAFVQDAQYDDQPDFVISPSLEPEWVYESSDYSHLVTFKPFFRYDPTDVDRTHVDIRDLSWVYVDGDFEYRVGIRKVFWGVTESQHLVDIINQTDFVENLDGEDKLGQPMVNVSMTKAYGTFDVFLLPYFRERTFAGSKGRFRTALPVSSSADYEAEQREKHVDWAVRWMQSFYAFDLGLSHFSGTGRDPIVQIVDGEIVPLYPLIQQTGVDVQATLGGFLVKGELISRLHKEERYSATVVGTEYTFYGVAGSSKDVGLLAEYMYDDRGEDATTAFEEDLFLAGRFVFNDVQSTEILAGGTFDLDTASTFINVEASRRFGDSLKASLEARAFMDVPADDLFASIRDDDYVLLNLEYFF